MVRQGKVQSGQAKWRWRGTRASLVYHMSWWHTAPHQQSRTYHNRIKHLTHTHCVHLCNSWIWSTPEKPHPKSQNSQSILVAPDNVINLYMCVHGCCVILLVHKWICVCNITLALISVCLVFVVSVTFCLAVCFSGLSETDSWVVLWLCWTHRPQESQPSAERQCHIH